MYYVLVDVHSTDSDVSNTDDIDNISSDNQETHEEVKHKSVDDISTCTENIIHSNDIQEEKCKINNYH